MRGVIGSLPGHGVSGALCSAGLRQKHFEPKRVRPELEVPGG